MTDLIQEVKVPTEMVPEIKDGKEKNWWSAKSSPAMCW